MAARHQAVERISKDRSDVQRIYRSEEVGAVSALRQLGATIIADRDAVDCRAIERSVRRVGGQARRPLPLDCDHEDTFGAEDRRD
ncbi:MAG: hypothetical protein AAFV62_01215 [Pseudomonadota bacterium]